MSLRLIENLRRRATDRSGEPALCCAGRGDAGAMVWGELARRVDGIAGELRRHLPAGATVLLCGPYDPDFIAAFLGVLAGELTLFPMPVDSAGPELQCGGRASAAAGAIVSERSACLLRSCFTEQIEISGLGAGLRFLLSRRWEFPRQWPGPALLLQSSGTTGEPKIVRRDGAAIDAVSQNMAEACGFTDRDRVLAAAPLSHSYGLEHGILAPLWAGSRVHVAGGFDLPLMLGELHEGGITLMPGVPFMFEMLCRSEGTKFPRLRKAYSAGGPLPRATYDTFLNRFGVRLGQLYGATEIGSVTFNDPDSPCFNPAAVGLPMRNVSVRILDVDNPRIALPIGAEGQVAVRARSMLSGYASGEPAPLIDGHFLTGDIGTLDTAGALTITGRLKLLIDVGGRKVNPAEVEAVLSKHPDVGLCVVLPLRVSENVWRVKAVVTPASPSAEISVKDLRRFARQRLSAYKVPRVFEVRATLPTSSVGKVLRHLVETS